MVSPIVARGSSDENGSWKTICIWLRSSRTHALCTAHVDAVEGDRAAVSVEEAQQDAPEGRLAAARLADQPEHLAGADVEIDTIDGADRRPWCHRTIPTSRGTA